MLWTRQVIYNIKVYIRLAKLNLQNVSSQYKVMLPSPGRKDSQDWRLLPFLWLWKDNHNRYPCVGTVLDNKYNLKPAFRIRIRIHRDPLNLAGSGSTSIPAPDPDPDPLRFLSSDPDPDPRQNEMDPKRCKTLVSRCYQPTLSHTNTTRNISLYKCSFVILWSLSNLSSWFDLLEAPSS